MKYKIQAQEGLSIEERVDVVSVTVKAGVTLKEPVTIENLKLRLVFKLERSAKVQVIDHTPNSSIQVDLAEQAELVWVKYQPVSTTATQMVVEQSSGSRLNFFTFSQNQEKTHNHLKIYLNGEGSFCEVYGLSVARKNQFIQHDTLIYHRVPNCKSIETYKSILMDSSKVVFNGRIRVEKDAQKTDSRQLSKTLLLGDHAQAETIPQLEIFADDVKCSHGATVGQINPDEVFYLESRGIPQQKAMELLCQGFVKDLINKIPNNLLKPQVQL